MTWNDRVDDDSIAWMWASDGPAKKTARSQLNVLESSWKESVAHCNNALHGLDMEEGLVEASS